MFVEGGGGSCPLIILTLKRELELKISNPCPEGCGGLSSSKAYFLDLLKKMVTSKFLLDVFGKMTDIGGGLVALLSLSTIKKGTSPFYFHPNKPFSRFLRQFLL